MAEKHLHQECKLVKEILKELSELKKDPGEQKRPRSSGGVCISSRFDNPSPDDTDNDNYKSSNRRMKWSRAGDSRRNRSNSRFNRNNGNNSQTK
eukprot:UN00388